MKIIFTYSNDYEANYRNLKNQETDVTLSKTSNNAAFSLIEMSVVLIIISLIVSGLLLSSSFIKAAQLKSVITEFQTFQTAANSFKQQYAYLPGDIPNATSIWKVVNQNENGNGNGDIDINSIILSEMEPLIFWKHLSLAGILPTQYNSSLSNNTPPTIIGTNIPASNYQSLDQVGLSCWGVYGKYLYLGGIYSGPISTSEAPQQHYLIPTSDAISPLDAYYIDQKIDDGHASSGFVKSQLGLTDLSQSSTACISNSPTVTDYNISNNARGCLMSFYYF